MAEAYTPQFIERLQFFADNPTPLVSKGVISDTRVGKFLGVSRQSVRRWKTPCAGFEDYYKKEFADCIAVLQGKFDSGDIKRSMIERARGFTQLKVVRELMPEGPELPALSVLSKAELIEVAKQKLGLALDDAMSVDLIKQRIIEERDARTKKKMIIVKKETVTQAGDVGAAKLVLMNIDKSNDKWNTADKSESEHGVNDELAELMRNISGRNNGLPIKE